MESSRPLSLLVVFLLSLAALIFLFATFPPGAFLSILGIHISYILIFFFLLFLTTYGLVAFILKSALQGIFAGGFLCTFLVFRLAGLTHPFFTIFLCLLFASIEAIVWKRR